MCFVSGWVRKVPKNLLTNFVLLSVRIFDAIPNVITHASKNIHSTAIFVILAVGTSLVSFDYLSVIITACWLPFIFLDSGSKISIATNSNGSVARNSCKWRLCLSVVPALAQLGSLVTVLNTLLATLNQY